MALAPIDVGPVIVPGCLPSGSPMLAGATIKRAGRPRMVRAFEVTAPRSRPFLRYAHRQGARHRPSTREDLFPQPVRPRVRV